jgi:anti-sigma-K factor RskA
MNTPMSDIHALAGAFAVNALDETERAEFERHLPGCAACQAEVASFRETAALLTETTTETPPASLRSGVLAGIREVRPLPPEAPRPEAEGRPAEPAVRRRRLVQVLSAAAAVVLLAVGAVLWQPWRDQSPSVADQVLDAADAVRVAQTLPGGAQLTLVRSPSLEKAVMVGEGVPEPPAGKTYQLWYQQPGEGLVSAGLMPDAHEPTVLTGDASTATEVAISVEPESGSAQPTTEPIAVFPLPAGTAGSP